MMRWSGTPLEAELQEMVVLVETSWEVALPGVREWNEHVLAALLDLALASSGWEAGEGATLRRLRDVNRLLAELTLRTSWSSKRKYFELKALARRYRGDLLRDQPVLLRGLLLGMASSHLASAATGVYCAVLSRLAGSGGLVQWQQHCLPPIIAALASSDRFASPSPLAFLAMSLVIPPYYPDIFRVNLLSGIV